MLSDIFGKNISENLCRISERSSELEEYLAFKTQGKKAVRGPLGIYIDCRGLHRLEVRYLLQIFLKEEHLILSRDVLETLLDQLKDPKSRSIEQMGRKMFVEKGIFFLLAAKPPTLFVEETEEKPGQWQDFWQNGSASLHFQELPVFLRRLIPIPTLSPVRKIKISVNAQEASS